MDAQTAGLEFLIMARPTVQQRFSLLGSKGLPHRFRRQIREPQPDKKQEDSGQPRNHAKKDQPQQRDHQGSEQILVKDAFDHLTANGFVASLDLGGVEERDALLDRRPDHVIDCRAQADGLIVQALDSLQLLESLAAQGIRFTFFLFPSEDTESMNNLLDLFFFAGDRVDYVVVHNPAKVRTNLFKKSNIEAELNKFGAKEITLPVVTSITLLAIKRAEAKAARKLSFAEVAMPRTSHLELMLAGEMQWAMQQMFRQYDAIVDLLVPTEQVPEVEPQPEPAAKPARSKQPMSI